MVRVGVGSLKRSPSDSKVAVRPSMDLRKASKLASSASPSASAMVPPFSMLIENIL